MTLNVKSLVDIVYWFFKGYGYTRKQHVLKPAIPTRRASDLSSAAALCASAASRSHRKARSSGMVSGRTERPAAMAWPPPASSRPSSKAACRSEEHTSELQSLMRISYDVFCLQKKTHNQHDTYALITRKHSLILTTNPT